MSHDLIDIALHTAQLEASHRQAAQLAQLNAQMAQQHAAQKQQAALVQVLFETESMTRRVLVTASQDPIAAGLLAVNWLQQYQSIGPERFATLEEKRTWTWAIDSLRLVYNQVSDSPLVAETLRAQHQLAELYKAGAPQAPQLMHEEHSTYEIHSQRKKSLLIIGLFFGAIALIIPIVLMVWAGIDSGNAGTGFGVALCLSPLSIPFIVLTIFPLIGSAASSDTASKARQKFLNLQTLCAQYQIFLTSPQGAPLLERMRREHPLAYQEPETRLYDAYFSSGEAHPIVFVCTYCGQLSQAQNFQCRNCGGPVPH